MSPKHIILISIDDLRFDAVRWQPDQRYWKALGIEPRLNTPTMDALAEECVLFNKCLSNAGYTPLSHATLFTGCYAHQHGVVNFHNTTCRPDVTTLSEYFSRVGYRTMLLTSKPRQTLFCEANCTLRHVDQRYADDEAFLAALRARRDENVFAVIHVCDVHDPVVRGGEEGDDPTDRLDWELFLRVVYNATAAEAESSDVILEDGRRMSYAALQAMAPGKSPPEIMAHLRRLYQAYLYTVENFDRYRFKKLIDGIRAAGAWDETLLIVTSDHGETQFWAHPWRLTHGALPDETIIRVPLMMKLPGVAARSVDHLSGLVDVVPTLLDAAGISTSELALDGRSLLPTIHHNRPAGDAYWIEGWSHELGDDEPHIVCRAIRRADGRKYIWNGDTIDADRMDAMNPSEFETYAARMSYGNPPSDWLRARIRTLAQEQSRAGALGVLLGECRPRHIILDNVDDDLTENNAVVVDESHSRWGEYQACQKEMPRLTASPHFGSELSDRDERNLTDHLRRLGYVQ